ncbi:hypothetical protein VNO77_05940 [Canavalia gladiata]|uniref:Uncharacterized protein n=1 Tax=Canavalia gladiata TaxID=3824 RepID=A0AAN9REN7_CANGL
MSNTEFVNEHGMVVLVVSKREKRTKEKEKREREKSDSLSCICFFLHSIIHHSQYLVGDLLALPRFDRSFLISLSLS